MPGVAPLAFHDIGNFLIQPLYVTVPGVWLKTSQLVADSAAPVFNPEQGDIRADSFITAVALNRQIGQRQQKIIVCGDADFMSNIRGGGEFPGIPFYSWLADNQFPIYESRNPPKDNMVTITTEGVSILKIVYVWILPGLLLLWGTILLIRRKRQ